MNSDKKIEQAAISEVVAPTLGVTEQFFSVHSLEDNNPVRYIEKIENYFLVYLAVKEERFYWVVKVEFKNNRYIATWGHCNPYSRVYISITSQIILPEFISKLLCLKSTWSGKKGEVWKGPTGKIIEGRVFKENFWHYELNLPEAQDLDDKLNSTLELLLSKANQLENLEKEHCIYINVAHYVHVNYTWGWNINKKQISDLHKVKAELSFDLYASGNWIED